jgi:hypothetical protein
MWIDQLAYLFLGLWRERRTPHYSSVRASTVDWPIDQMETLRARGSSPKSNNLYGCALFCVQSSVLLPCLAVITMRASSVSKAEVR